MQQAAEAATCRASSVTHSSPWECFEFGISRKTGYRIFERYKDYGVAAFTDRSQRPYRQAN
jgi:hypothetical protein